MATLVEIYRIHARGEYELAIIEAEESLKGMTCSRDGSMWVKLNCIVGDALLDLKRFEEAEARFDLVRTQCRHPVALANRGYAKWMQGAYEAAFKDVMAAVKTNEGSDIEGSPQGADWLTWVLTFHQPSVFSGCRRRLKPAM